MEINNPHSQGMIRSKPYRGDSYGVSQVKHCHCVWGAAGVCFTEPDPTQI